MSRVDALVSVLEGVLGKQLDELAVEFKVVRRKRKFTGQSLVRMLVLTLLEQPEATVADWALTASQMGIEVSATAVEKRFTQPLVDFLQAACQIACQQILEADPVKTELLQSFSAVLIGDSSSIALPDEMQDEFPGCGGTHGGGKAAIKIQVRCDLKTGALPQVVVEVGTASDAQSVIAQQPAQAGALEIFDLGYFDLTRFGRLMDSQAYFVSRLQHGTKVFDLAGNPLELRDFLPAHEKQGLVDVTVLVGSKDRLQVRLVAVRAPAEVAHRRRQKASEKARDKGREISSTYSELLGWSLYITNASRDLLSWQAIVVVYRARWQIELLFKLWKSHNKLATHRPGANVYEVMSVLWAKLIGVLLQHWLQLISSWPDDRRSLTKIARVIRRWIVSLISVLDQPRQLRQLLTQLCDHIKHVPKIQSRHKNPSNFQLLNNPKLLTWNA